MISFFRKPANPFKQHAATERERWEIRRAEETDRDGPSLFDHDMNDKHAEASAELRSRINVGRTIFGARCDLGLSQEEVARLAGTTQARVSTLETLEHNARFDTLDRVAAALGLEIALVPRASTPLKCAVEKPVSVPSDGPGT